MSRQNRLEVLEMSRALRTNGKYGNSPSFFLVWQKQTFIVNWEIHRNMSILDSSISCEFKLITLYPGLSLSITWVVTLAEVPYNHSQTSLGFRATEFHWILLRNNKAFLLEIFTTSKLFSKYVPINVSVETLDYDRQLGLCLLIRVSWPWMFVLLFRLSSECGNSWSTDL